MLVGLLDLSYLLLELPPNSEPIPPHSNACSCTCSERESSVWAAFEVEAESGVEAVAAAEAEGDAGVEAEVGAGAEGVQPPMSFALPRVSVAQVSQNRTLPHPTCILRVTYIPRTKTVLFYACHDFQRVEAEAFCDLSRGWGNAVGGGHVCLSNATLVRGP